jgi:hypothetical protein
MARKTVTFRSQTVGSVSDFISDEGLNCQESQNLLSALAGALLSYKDEGVELSPTILFCTDAAAVFESFPGSVKHAVGTAPLGAACVKQVLKDCAPLATRSWSIFIERTPQGQARYGVFNYITLPTTLPLHEAIGITSGVTCLLLRKVSPTTIEVLGSKGNELSLVFSTTREDETHAASPVGPFALDCCRDIPGGSYTVDFRSYFKLLLEEGLSRCHGTILVCATEPVLSNMGDMKDGIEIVPKLDFFAAFSTFRSDGSAESILRLQSAEELFSGILQCDGIVVFDTTGCLVAYRVFYRPSQPGPVGSAAPAGGARRRAFEGAKTMIGSTLTSVLFRSQDGLTIREGGA